MLLTPTRIDTAALTYVKDAKVFSAFDSDLPRPSAAYDDACDLGYTLVSHRTGTEIVFVQDDIIRDREGDITHWVYRIAPEARRRMNRQARTALANVVLHVYND